MTAVADKQTEYDCRSCGACCTIGHKPEDGEGLAGVSGADANRMTNKQVRRLVVIHDGAGIMYEYTMKLRADGRCAALQGTIGKQVRCEIYLRRPNDCRAFEPGSSRCVKWREREGIE